MNISSNHRKKLVEFRHKKRVPISRILEIFVIAKEEMRRESYAMVQRCIGVTKFKQAENKASNHVFGTYIFSRCDDSCLGTGIRLLIGR